MDWVTASLLLAGGLILALGSNLPVAFAFGVLNLIAAWFLFGRVDALSFLVQSAYSSIANIYLSAIPFFVLMGMIFVRAELSGVVLESIGKMTHGVRASGAYVAVFGGIMLGALMGASVASIQAARSRSIETCIGEPVATIWVAPTSAGRVRWIRARPPSDRCAIDSP